MKNHDIESVNKVYSHVVRSGLACALGLALSLAAATPGLAQVGASEANGTVVDKEGNPLQGVEVTFRPRANPTMEYTGKTNKKGRYFVSGLWTPKEGDRWDVTVSAEGFLPIEVTIESRTVNRVLVGGEIWSQKLKAGSKIGDIVIRPLGSAKVDLRLAPEEEVRQPVQAASVDDSGVVDVPEKQEAPKPDPWNEALRLAGKGELEASLQFFGKAIEDESDDAERVATYAKVLYELERFDQAEQASIRAIQLEPQRLDVRKVLSSVYLKQGDVGQAQAALVEAAALDPEDIEIQERMAYVAGQQGNTEQAVASYETITRIDPENADAWLALGGLYAAAGQLEKSEQAYQVVVELDPSQAYQTFYNLGVLILKRDDRSDADTRRAIDAFNKSVEINPDYGPAYRQLGSALLGVGDRPGALKALENYVRVSPGAPDAARMKGLIQALKQ